MGLCGQKDRRIGGRNGRLDRDGKWREVYPLRTPIEAQRRYGGPWKPAELSDEAVLTDGGPVVLMAGIDEPQGVADAFAIKADPDSDPDLIKAARVAAFTVVEA